MEDFVTFEIALKLKEKGFNIPFYFFYRTDDKLLHHANITNPLVYGGYIDDEVIIAPTISQVLKWLRDEKGLHICINIYDDGWFFDISSFYKEDSGVYEVKLPYMSSNVTPDYDTYEQAAIAGVNYCLDNLI